MGGGHVTCCDRCGILIRIIIETVNRFVPLQQIQNFSVSQAGVAQILDRSLCRKSVSDRINQFVLENTGQLWISCVVHNILVEKLSKLSRQISTNRRFSGRKNIF